MATCAFVGAATSLIVRPGALTSRCARPARIRPTRSSFSAPRRRAPTFCLATGAQKKAEEEEDEVLDEKAMRAAEIHEVLVGLEEFKMRIVDDATKLAKKVRAPKKQLESALASHPDILKIEGHIAELQEELKKLGDR